ncbi:MAG: hypothetical protein JKY22_12125 [Flavobacteriaceae bacterium]|nr:hypothetical protein [Flavobacteriaceae bacterium]PCJ26495.1 MAG: hypothetical protein COA94_05140 [Rickettsiales bacterium]
MARNPFRDIQQIATTTLTTVYTAATGINSTISVVSLVNTTATALNIDVYHNDGATDFLKNTIHIPGGAGRERLYYGFERGVLAAGDSIKVQADGATAFNLAIYGSEIESS